MASAENERNALRPPKLSIDWALFLDIDGTLIDFATRPEGVTIPDNLDALLNAASIALSGALALVTGRSPALIDMLPFARGRICAAEHGAILIDADGGLTRVGGELPAGWMARAQLAVVDWPGAWLEEKTCGFSINFKLAKDRETAICAFIECLAGEDSRFELMRGHNVIELRRRDLHKGAALRALMAWPIFAGRVPVFVGDDVTDEDGIAAAKDLGGIGLHVKRDFAGKTAHVRDWLAQFGG